MHKHTEQKKSKQEKEQKQPEKKIITLTEEEYNQLKQEAEKSKEYSDNMLRLRADFDNSRKRLEREKQEFLRFANEGMIVDLLNVIDDLERTIQLAEEQHEDFAAFLKGIEMILAHLYDLLKKNGLSPIEAKGRIFDPVYHEALLKVETDEFDENTVVEELQKGYLLNDRVIRTAKVKVSKRPPTGEDLSSEVQTEKEKSETEEEKTEEKPEPETKTKE